MSVSARAQGTTAATTLELAVTADDTHVRYGTLLDKAPQIPLRLTANAKMTPDALTIDDAKLTLQTAEVHVKGNTALRDPNAYDLIVTTPATSLTGWEHVLPALADYTLDGQASQHSRAGKQPPRSAERAWHDRPARCRCTRTLDTRGQRTDDHRHARRRPRTNGTGHVRACGCTRDTHGRREELACAHTRCRTQRRRNTPGRIRARSIRQRRAIGRRASQGARRRHASRFGERTDAQGA